MDETITTSRTAVEQAAARVWHLDDLAVRARKTAAVIRWAIGTVQNVDDLTDEELDLVLDAFARVEGDSLAAHLRTDGSYEIRHVAASAKPVKRARGWGTGQRNPKRGRGARR